ncbi:pirin domain-containing protein domain-containing protein [Coprinopsis cinerea okayama7|uniref:Pirin domain-containing protein domain-containing protein n=1 Tax=Coprinopsis cinerea (strain Okayama-7 / 130 / ATCC MYA-4618 / FGSC 9003) TaxID=240176 RepID=A8NAE3_COPC7|nr:pirin domain-containing protein domain-containing protein [Coprinopsis cinerea okayama7\|eukprot:XP_001831795.1 pirin domain-containing protein domain-containing protein [Coprinopsis cinerea okayama7\
MASAFEIITRRSEERGHADHGWLKTFHTFSFAMYYDLSHQQYGPLRVINEDRVAAHRGFGMHSHREFEIFSYVVSGQLQHKDSMGNVEILKRGDIQMTSAGTGISHSEGAYGGEPVHFLQIWALPSQSRLTPKYYTRHFSDEEKKDQWAKVVAPAWSKGIKTSERNGDGPAPVNSALTLYSSILGEGKALDRPLEGKKGYIHVIQRSGYREGPASGATVQIDDGQGGKVDLREGDGAYVRITAPNAVLKFQNTGDRPAEILVFDLE